MLLRVLLSVVIYCDGVMIVIFNNNDIKNIYIDNNDNDNTNTNNPVNDY